MIFLPHLDIAEFQKNLQRYSSYNVENKKEGQEEVVSIKYFDPGIYVFHPPNIQIKRATNHELGFGVLGVAYLGTNQVIIGDWLYDEDYLEVLVHEYGHIQNPLHTERRNREETKYKLPFDCKYQF